MSPGKNTKPAKEVAVKATQSVLENSPTGIVGFDEITDGGVPKGRSALIVIASI